MLAGKFCAKAVVRFCFLFLRWERAGEGTDRTWFPCAPWRLRHGPELPAPLVPSAARAPPRSTRVPQQLSPR